jgi:hypothetical protein
VSPRAVFLIIFFVCVLVCVWVCVAPIGVLCFSYRWEMGH